MDKNILHTVCNDKSMSLEISYDIAPSSTLSRHNLHCRSQIDVKMEQLHRTVFFDGELTHEALGRRGG